MESARGLHKSRQPGMGCYHSWMPSRDIIKYPCIRQTRKNNIHHPTRAVLLQVMPFGLKNARAMYQRLVNKMFRPLLGKTIEVYIDDMLVKSKERSKHAEQLQEAFELLRAYRMNLNPSRCAFGVSARGFMVTQRGIEANPTQLKAILESPAPASRKGV